jgi:hypothetical protein
MFRPAREPYRAGADYNGRRETFFLLPRVGLMNAKVFRMILVTVLVTLATGVGSAGTHDTVTAQATKCSARNSERVTIPQISADPQKYRGRCIAVEGVMQRASLFESVDGLYLQPPDILNPASNGLRIGLDNISRHFSERYRHVSILGRVQDCETVRSCVHASAAEGEVVMVNGYCHYFNGPYVFVHDLELRRGPAFERRMGDYGRDGYGDLGPAPEDWPHRATVDALASEFLRALRSNDRERLAGLHFRDVGLDWKDDETALLHFLLSARDSPFASIRTSQTPPERVVLVERLREWRPQREGSSGNELSDYTATVCFCREKSCTGRWPIATFDADNIPARPYACTTVGPYLEGDRWVPHFTTAIGRVGLVEPRAR